MTRAGQPKEIAERLLAVGLGLFLRQGYNGTGIQQITCEAGVPKGSFYNHFASKEAFAATIVDRYAADSEHSWKRMMSTAPEGPLATIRHVFSAMLAHHERISPPTGCLIGNFAAELASASGRCRERLLSAQLGWRERLADLIRDGQTAGEIRADIDAVALSALTWSLWEGALLRMKVEGSVEPVRESIRLAIEHLYLPMPAAHAAAAQADDFHP